MLLAKGGDPAPMCGVGGRAQAGQGEGGADLASLALTGPAQPSWH